MILRVGVLYFLISETIAIFLFFLFGECLEELGCAFFYLNVDDKNYGDINTSVLLSNYLSSLSNRSSMI